MSKRFKVQVGVVLLARNHSCELLTEWVSHRGIFVRTDSPPPPMQLLRLQFVLPPDDASVELHGMVSQVVGPTTDYAMGVDITFFAKMGDAAKRWDAFVTEMRLKHPEALDRPVLVGRGDGAPKSVRLQAAVPHARIATPVPPLVKDLTRGGMFVQTGDDVAVGADLKVTLLDASSGESLDVDCVARRRTMGAGGGVGLEFRNMTDAGFAAVMRLSQGAAGTMGLQAELQEVHAPHAPRMMHTQPGPFLSGPPPARASRDDRWSLPPEDGWGAP